MLTRGSHCGAGATPVAPDTGGDHKDRLQQMEKIMHSNKKSWAALALAAAAVVPLGLAAPAHASTYKDGCTVTPKAPYFAGTYTAGNVPEVYYPYDLTCLASNAAMSVEVKTETWESDLAGRAGDVDANGVDNADDEYIGQATSNTNFGSPGGSRTVLIKGVLPHTDTDSNEEVYHKVKFRVTSGLVTGGWTNFELTQATKIWW
jgi:hypothetical protein